MGTIKGDAKIMLGSTPVEVKGMTGVKIPELEWDTETFHTFDMPMQQEALKSQSYTHGSMSGFVDPDDAGQALIMPGAKFSSAQCKLYPDKSKTTYFAPKAGSYIVITKCTRYDITKSELMKIEVEFFVEGELEKKTA